MTTAVVLCKECKVRPATPGFKHCSKVCAYAQENASARAFSGGGKNRASSPAGGASVKSQAGESNLCPHCKLRAVNQGYKHCSKQCALEATGKYRTPLGGKRACVTCLVQNALPGTIFCSAACAKGVTVIGEGRAATGAGRTETTVREPTPTQVAPGTQDVPIGTIMGPNGEELEITQVEVVNLMRFHPLAFFQSCGSMKERAACTAKTESTIPKQSFILVCTLRFQPAVFPPMHGLRQEIVPASGVEYAEFINLTPRTKRLNGTVVTNLVVARANVLRIFEVLEEPAPLPTLEEAEAKAAAGTSKLGTEAVEGEVAMDAAGEGFVNLAQVKTLPAGTYVTESTVLRLYHLREHRLHGIVTGLGSVKTIATGEDGLDRLLISFEEAKMSLMEWSDLLHDLTTVSLHTYERVPQVLATDSQSWSARLRLDPSNRCAALSLPKETFAVLPFHTSAELEMLDQEKALSKDIPYSPSFVLNMVDVDVKIKNIIDFVFIPGFNNPTLAVAFQTIQTWTGRLNEFKDTVSIYVITLDTIARSFPIISQINGMPYDVLYLVPCPANLGGVMLVTPNAILHVDQTSRTVGIAVNGWANRSSSIVLPIQNGEDGLPLDLKLEGSRMSFVRDDSITLFLSDGTIRRVAVAVEGRTITKIEVSCPVVQSVPPSTVCVFGDHVFLGNTSGASVLLKASHLEEVVEKSATAPVQEDLDMDLDEDIYGDLATQAMAANAVRPDVETRTVLKLGIQDSLPGIGVLAHMTFGMTFLDEKPLPELIACTGAEQSAGFTRFTNHIPMRTTRRFPVVAGKQGLWSMLVKPSAGSRTKVRHSDGRDTIIVSTSLSPSPGISRILSTTSGGDVHIIGRTPGVTVAAAPFFQNTKFVQVLTDTIRLVESDGRERATIKNPSSSRIVSADVSDPHILVRREDGSVTLYVGDAMDGKITKRENASLPPASFASLFTDDTATFLDASRTSDNVTEALENVLDSGRGSRWAFLMLKTGEIQIYSLPDLKLIFSSPILASLPMILTHQATLSEQYEEPLETSFVQSICIAPVGEGPRRTLHLAVITLDGVLVVYESLPSPVGTGSPIRFMKVLSRILEHGAATSAQFVPFDSELVGTTVSGLFYTGSNPFWLISRRASPIRFYEAGITNVQAFAACSITGDKGGFLVQTEEGTALLQWVGDVQLGMELPYRTIYTPRQYTSVVYNCTTHHVLAVSSQKTRFSYWDDDGNNMWSGDAPGVTMPFIESSALELLSPDTWTCIDGYEFAQNEFVNIAESVSLETLSAERGQKDFIVVGTTIYRGEDLAVKGATYIFEVVEVVREPGSLKRRDKLKLLCRDESKGPVTAVCGMNGYLVSSMGQKIYVRAFDLDERLIGMAFLDVGLYVTSLRTVKNLLLISDAVKSVWFVGFQEDPFKLVVLSRDPETASQSNANFFFGDDGDLAFFATDDNGVLRIYDYNPLDPDSDAGQRLMCRTEFDAHCEHRTIVTVARRPPPIAVTEEEDMPVDESPATAAQSVLICGTLQGSLAVVYPINATQYKRLSLLQGQLVRNVQHVAGLNPKAFRAVRNERVSRPLTKGLLDGPLLNSFADLPIERQTEATKQIGTDRAVILDDLRTLWRTW